MRPPSATLSTASRMLGYSPSPGPTTTVSVGSAGSSGVPGSSPGPGRGGPSSSSSSSSGSSSSHSSTGPNTSGSSNGWGTAKVRRQWAPRAAMAPASPTPTRAAQWSQRTTAGSPAASPPSSSISKQPSGSAPPSSVTSPSVSMTNSQRHSGQHTSSDDLTQHSNQVRTSGGPGASKTKPQLGQRTLTRSLTGGPSSPLSRTGKRWAGGRTQEMICLRRAM